MPGKKIDAHKVTKPIQLLAAWLVGLIAIDGSFLTAAGIISSPAWIPAALTLAAIINVPVFLVCIFLLQTKFRPEMQEDTYYAKFLENRMLQMTGKETGGATVDALRMDLLEINGKTLKLISDLNINLKGLTEDIAVIQSNKDDSKAIQEKLVKIEQRLSASANEIRNFEKQINWQRSRIAINDLLPNYNDILKKISDLGANVKETFGSSSEEPEVPKKLIISFGEEIDIEHLRALVPLLIEYGFEYIDFSPDPLHEGRIYVGSYVYQYPDEWKLVKKLDDELLKLLKNEETTIDSLIMKLGYSSKPNKGVQRTPLKSRR